MPEGPEIRRAADQVQQALMAAPIDEVYFAFDHLQAGADRFANCAVTAVETRGKAMLIHFDNALSIYSHNQLYGRWFVRKARTAPNTRRQLRLALHNAEKSALLYSASEIDVLDADGIAVHPFLSRLGPDVPGSTAKAVLARLREPRLQRRRLGVLYLDQGFVAGIGNYLRSEILFLAGLHPLLRPCDCAMPRPCALSRRDD